MGEADFPFRPFLSHSFPLSPAFSLYLFPSTVPLPSVLLEVGLLNPTRGSGGVL